MSFLLYLSRRIAQSIPILFAVTLISFSLIHLIPGDPVRNILGMRATEESISILRDQLGLDKPLHTQYIDFVINAARLDFGTSIALKNIHWFAYHRSSQK